MKKSKEFMVNFLKGKGASAEELASFEKVFDEDFTNLTKSEADKVRETQQVEWTNSSKELSNLAAEVSLRGSGA